MAAVWPRSAAIRIAWRPLAVREQHGHGRGRCARRSVSRRRAVFAFASVARPRRRVSGERRRVFRPTWPARRPKASAERSSPRSSRWRAIWRSRNLPWTFPRVTQRPTVRLTAGTRDRRQVEAAFLGPDCFAVGRRRRQFGRGIDAGSDPRRPRVGAGNESHTFVGRGNAMTDRSGPHRVRLSLRAGDRKRRVVATVPLTLPELLSGGLRPADRGRRAARRTFGGAKRRGKFRGNVRRRRRVARRRRFPPPATTARRCKWWCGPRSRCGN